MKLRQLIQADIAAGGNILSRNTYELITISEFYISNEPWEPFPGLTHHMIWKAFVDTYDRLKKELKELNLKDLAAPDQKLDNTVEP